MDRFSAHLDRGWDLLSRGDTIQALVAARQALDIDAESPEVHNLLGYIHALQGDFEEALEWYRRATELDEWYLEPLLNAAELLAHPDADPSEAVRMCRRAADLELSPEERADALLIEVEALLNLGLPQEARERLGVIVEPESLPVAYHVALGRALFDVGDLSAASPFITRALELDATLPDAWYTKGLLDRDEGRRVEAVIAFLEVRTRDLALPRPPWARVPQKIEELVREVIASLEPMARKQLSGVEIRIANYPSVDQIRQEIDPRQVVLAQGVDPQRETFELLWIFMVNLERVAGPLPPNDELRSHLIAELNAAGRGRDDV